jgi:hypothetical protein
MSHRLLESSLVSSPTFFSLEPTQCQRKSKLALLLVPLDPPLGSSEALNLVNDFYNDLIKNFLPHLGGYYTIEQTKSRLRIIVLNTNFMKHDFKYSQSHLSAVRQRPDGSVLGQQQYNMGYHRKHYHHDNDEHNNNNNYNRYNKDRYYGSHSNSDEARLNFQNGATENGERVSALSVSHESEKQWEWFEDVLAKSSRNSETVSKQDRRLEG